MFPGTALSSEDILQSYTMFFVTVNESQTSEGGNNDYV